MKIILCAVVFALAALAQTKLEVEGAHEKGLTKGSDLYHEYCATCHGKDGKGSGPAAAALKTTPADLTQLAAKNGGKFPVGTLRLTLGGGSTPAHGSTEMPVWGPIFRAMAPNTSIAKLRADNLLRYLESIQQK